MQTIIAAFENIEAAQQAVERLVQQGLVRDSIHMQSQTPSEATRSSKKTAPPGDPFGFFGFFSSLLGAASTDQAGNYAEAMHRGNAVVIVEALTDAEVVAATTLLQTMGVLDVEQRAAQWKSEGWTGFGAVAAPADGQEQGAGEQTVVPVVQEEMKVGKRIVEGAGIQVVKRVTETPVSELVKLRQEHATIERRSVDRPATDADLADFKEGTIEIRERSEEAVVGKTTRVVEEVVVGKAVTERIDTVSDTVRRTDVEVKRQAGQVAASADADDLVRSAS